jgi:hypothetical protein
MHIYIYTVQLKVQNISRARTVLVAHNTDKYYYCISSSEERFISFLLLLYPSPISNPSLLSCNKSYLYSSTAYSTVQYSTPVLYIEKYPSIQRKTKSNQIITTLQHCKKTKHKKGTFLFIYLCHSKTETFRLFVCCCIALHCIALHCMHFMEWWYILLEYFILIICSTVPTW